MKYRIFFLGIFIQTLFSCGKSDLLKPFGAEDNTPPNVVTDVTYEPIPGGALIKYVLPHDEDLLYVKAVYSVKGEERNSVASQYNSELLIEGLLLLMIILLICIALINPVTTLKVFH